MFGTLTFAQLKIAELLSLFVQLGIFFKCFISILYNFSILIILQIFYKSLLKQKSSLAKCKGLIFIYKCSPGICFILAQRKLFAYPNLFRLFYSCKSFF